MPWKLKKHESVNLIRLKQTGKLNAMETEQKDKTAGAIQKAEKNFALDLPMMVEETARDVENLNAISTLQSNQIESIFYPYRPTEIIYPLDSACCITTIKSLFPKQWGQQ